MWRCRCASECYGSFHLQGACRAGHERGICCACLSGERSYSGAQMIFMRNIFYILIMTMGLAAPAGAEMQSLSVDLEFRSSGEIVLARLGADTIMPVGDTANELEQNKATHV